MATQPLSAKHKQSLPIHLPLPDKETPWRASQQVFARLSQQSNQDDYKQTLLQPSDPDYAFVAKYFQADCPTNRAISRIYCIHNANQSLAFEHTIPIMEKEASNPVFSPKWQTKESQLPARQQAYQRFQALSSPYSPFSIRYDSQRKQSYSQVKLLPVWHGSNTAKCHSICQTGFTYFGKHLQGTKQSTDQGFFGSGIYFTTSARYAANIYSDGQNLMMAWVSMREPFPVVADQPHPNKPSDMQMLEAKGAYENYNAHYIPVISIDPDNSKCAIYYPCTLNQEPDCDEIVVFQKTQTLVRYWVEMVVDLPKSPSNLSPLETVSNLLDALFDLLDQEQIQQNPELHKLLEHKSEFLLTLNLTDPLSREDSDFYQRIHKLTDQSGKVRSLVAKSLLPQSITSPSPTTTTSTVLPSKMPTSSSAIVPSPVTLSNDVPSLAFGKAKWEQYFGNVGIEPPLPKDIAKILESPCPIWLDKKVKETHMLVLIPKKVNGQRLTLGLMGQLVQKPKQGHATKYNGSDFDKYEKTSVQQSHWLLMTRDILPYSYDKSYKDQLKLVQNLNQRSKVKHEVPRLLDATVCIFVEYVQSGNRLYSDNPWTYTRCQEKGNYGQMVVGGFDAAGGLYAFRDFGRVNFGVAVFRKFS